MFNTSTKNIVKLAIILFIIILLLTLPITTEYIRSIFENTGEPKNSGDEFEGIIQVTTYVSESVILKNENNMVVVRALGMNPDIRMKVNQILNGTIQRLTLKVNNVSPKNLHWFLNNETFEIFKQSNIEQYSISTTNNSIIFVFSVESGADLELRTENKFAGNDSSFVVIGDTQGRNDIFELMVPMINDRNPDFVLHCGDMTSMSTIKQFEEFLEVADELNMPVFPTPGNHDVKDGGENYQKFFGPMEYSFIVDGYKFISVDSSRQTLTSDQFQRLMNESKGLEGFGAKNVMFTHVPPFSSLLPEHLYMDPDITIELIKILEENDFEYCFSGHLHIFNYTRQAGVNYITSGGGGAAPYATEELGGFRHFIDVKMNDNGSDFEVVRINEDQFKDESTVIDITGPRGKINVDLNDLKTFEYLEATSACQNQYSNWAGNGTYTGVDVRILLELVGGMGENDTLLVKAIDGYYQEFSYYNVYLNDSWFEIQGLMVLSYEYNGDEPPDWSEGLRLMTMPEDGGYSLEDCKNTSVPGQGYWQYQSAGARWIKNVVSLVVESG